MGCIVCNALEANGFFTQMSREQEIMNFLGSHMKKPLNVSTGIAERQQEKVEFPNYTAKFVQRWQNTSDIEPEILSQITWIYLTKYIHIVICSWCQ